MSLLVADGVSFLLKTESIQCDAMLRRQQHCTKRAVDAKPVFNQPRIGSRGAHHSGAGMRTREHWPTVPCVAQSTLFLSNAEGSLR